MTTSHLTHRLSRIKVPASFCPRLAWLFPFPRGTPAPAPRLVWWMDVCVFLCVFLCVCVHVYMWAWRVFGWGSCVQMADRFVAIASFPEGLCVLLQRMIPASI
mmetsp:Transcript_48077/g.120379  ORF Transcript_48077/g.120379 Transcript_48077/m.120379 type:complete len:103 (-) Transcript_48077:95-403(-)